MLKRRVHVDHSTINRWVVNYSPQLEEAFHRRKRRCLTGVNSNSKEAPEFVAIEEQPNDEIVHALRLGEA
jgi:transposase-like protein